MTVPCLAFVESNTSGTGRLFARAAAQQGFRPVLLCSDPTRYKYAEEDGLSTIEVDTTDQKALLKVCEELAAAPSLAGLMSSSEYFVATAAAVAFELALSGPNHAAVQKYRDKENQRWRLKQAGIGQPAFQAASSVNAAIAAAETIGFPVVVKPVAGTGSIGVKLCCNSDDVARHSKGLLSLGKNERGLSARRRILIEELVLGPEYSVETFDNRVIGITGKHLGSLPYFVEVGHDFPAALPSELERVISQTALHTLNALDLGWGPAHLELRLADEKPKIIEVNPRLAGGFIPELVRFAYGLDLISETLKRVTGQEPQLEKRSNGYASLRFILPANNGFITGVENLAVATQVPGVVEMRLYSEVGAFVQRQGDFRDRIGHVIATGDTPEAACAGAESALSRIRVILEETSAAATEER